MPIRGKETVTKSFHDISDAIFILSYLFSNGQDPACFDSADANDDGAVDISDAIALLSYLFNGAGDLPEPFGECGVDPTDDKLGCEDYLPSCDIEEKTFK